MLTKHGLESDSTEYEIVKLNLCHLVREPHHQALEHTITHSVTYSIHTMRRGTGLCTIIQKSYIPVKLSFHDNNKCDAMDHTKQVTIQKQFADNQHQI